MERVPPPLTPKWALVFTTAALIGATAGILLFHVVWTVPLTTVAGWTMAMTYLVVAFAWSALEWPTRNAAVYGNNFFVIVAFGTFLVAAVLSPVGQPFPRWGTILLISAAVLCYSVMGICGVRNFCRWLRGAYSQKSGRSLTASAVNSVASDAHSR